MGLNSSTADYLVVAGHYPVWSICEHGPTKVLVERLKPLLEHAHVSVYLAGHDHCAQHIDEGTGVQYHGVGAGYKYDGSVRHKDAIPKGSLKYHMRTTSFDSAFASVSIT